MFEMYSEKKVHQKTELVVSSKVTNRYPHRENPVDISLARFPLKYFFPTPYLDQSTPFRQYFLIFPPIHPFPFSSLHPPNPIDTDTKHKVLELKKAKGVHFYFKIGNSYAIGWYFFSVVYVTKNIYAIRNNLWVWKCEN